MGLEKEDTNILFAETGKSNTTATTMAFTRELKKDEGFPTLSNVKSTERLQNFGSVIKEDLTEFSTRNTHQPTVQTFGLSNKVQNFNPVNKQDTLDNDDAWGDFNLFAENKPSTSTQPQTNFADKFASKLKKQQQFFKEETKTTNTFEVQKKEKQVQLAEKISNTMNRGKNVEQEIVGQRNMTKNIDLEIQAEDAKFEDTYECQDCGRQFKRDALEKHKNVCKKVFQTKRKEFQVEEKRMVTEDQKILAKKGERKMNTQKNLSKKNGKEWKKKSEGLKNFIKKKAVVGQKEPEIEVLVK